jgi:transposase-like protein
MLGFGPPADRQARREWWRRHVQRQIDSNLSVAQFCRRLGVSAVTFYSWKRRFRDEAPVAASATAKSDDTSVAAFLPVAIVDSSAAGKLEIDLGNTCVVRLTGTVDAKLLRIAIRAAGQLDGNRRGDY